MITVEQPPLSLFSVEPPVLRPCSTVVPAAACQLSISCGGRLPFLQQIQVARGTAFYSNHKAPAIREPETWGPSTLLCEEPQARGIPSMSSALGGCLSDMGRLHFCAKKPRAPLPPTAEAGSPDLATIPINGCSCSTPSPANTSPPMPSCCCHRN